MGKTSTQVPPVSSASAATGTFSPNAEKSATKPKQKKRKPTANRGKVRLMQEDLYALVGKSDSEIAAAIRALTAKGRPPKALDPNRVMLLRASGCSESEIAADARMDLTTFRAKVKNDPFIRKVFAMGDDLGTGQLRWKQHMRAMAGSDTMLIWLGKNRLGQKDEAAGAPGANHIAELMTVMRMAKQADRPDLDACEPAPLGIGAPVVDITPQNGSNGQNGHA